MKITVNQRRKWKYGEMGYRQTLYKDKSGRFYRPLFSGKDRIVSFGIGLFLFLVAYTLGVKTAVYW